MQSSRILLRQQTDESIKTMQSGRLLLRQQSSLGTFDEYRQRRPEVIDRRDALARQHGRALQLDHLASNARADHALQHRYERACDQYEKRFQEAAHRETVHKKNKAAELARRRRQLEEKDEPKSRVYVRRDPSLGTFEVVSTDLSKPARLPVLNKRPTLPDVIPHDRWTEAALAAKCANVVSYQQLFGTTSNGVLLMKKKQVPLLPGDDDDGQSNRRNRRRRRGKSLVGSTGSPPGSARLIKADQPRFRPRISSPQDEVGIHERLDRAEDAKNGGRRRRRQIEEDAKTAMSDIERFEQQRLIQLEIEKKIEDDKNNGNYEPEGSPRSLPVNRNKSLLTKLNLR